MLLAFIGKDFNTCKPEICVVFFFVQASLQKSFEHQNEAVLCRAYGKLLQNMVAVWGRLGAGKSYLLKNKVGRTLGSWCHRLIGGRFVWVLK